MSFLDKMRADKMQSMRDKDKLKTGVLSLMMSAISWAEKEGNKTLTDEEALVFVRRELKQTKDALETTPADRQDLIDENNRKIEIIEAYLPEQMTAEELREKVAAIVAEKGIEKTPKSKGLLMKEVMALYKDQTDGKTVNAIVTEVLNN